MERIEEGCVQEGRKEERNNKKNEGRKEGRNKSRKEGSK